MQKKIQVNGYLKAVASIEAGNPFQTKVSFILTDFGPNDNAQGVPITEKANIMRTARNAPLKIYFVGEDYKGHRDSIPLGPIVDVYEGKDGDRDVIFGDAIIWNEYHTDITDHLKSAIAEKSIGTSWEIYYKDSDVDDNGVEWIKDCIFAGSCIVKIPSYGPTRTRILAIAEKLSHRESTLSDNEPTEPTELEVVEDSSADNTQVDKLWSKITTLYEKTPGNKLDTEQLTIDQSDHIVTQIEVHIQSLEQAHAELQAKYDTVQSELAGIKDKQAQAESLNRRNSRRTQLKEVGVEFDDESWEKRVSTYEAMTDEAFATYVHDLQTVRLHSAKAEHKAIKFPEPSNEPAKILSAKEIAEHWETIINEKRG